MLDGPGPRRPPPQGRRMVLLLFAAVFLFGVFVGALCEAVVMYRLPPQ
jgi:hypothetical protein